MEPWEVLELAEAEAGDAVAVKRAYARLLKRHRPDRDPEGFRRVRDAYETLSARLAWRARLGLGAEPVAAVDTAASAPADGVAEVVATVAADGPPPPVSTAAPPLPADARPSFADAAAAVIAGDAAPAAGAAPPPTADRPAAEPPPWILPPEPPAAAGLSWEPPAPPPGDEVWFDQRLAEVAAGTGSVAALTEAAARLVAASTPATRAAVAERLGEALAERPEVLAAACGDDWLLATWQDGAGAPLRAVVAHAAASGDAQRAEGLAGRLAGHPAREGDAQTLLVVANALALWSPALALRLANDAFRALPLALRVAVERVEAHAAVGAEMNRWPFALRVAVARALDAGKLGPGLAGELQRHLIHLGTTSPLRAALRQRLPELRQRPPAPSAAPERSRVQIPNWGIVLLIMVALAIGRGLLSGSSRSSGVDHQTAERERVSERVRAIMADSEQRRLERLRDESRRAEDGRRAAVEREAAALRLLADARRARERAAIAVLVGLPADERRARLDQLIAGDSPGMHRGGGDHRSLLIALAASVALSDAERAAAARALAALGDAAALAELADRDDLPAAVRAELKLPAEAAAPAPSP